jgi:hypothetical protein
VVVYTIQSYLLPNSYQLVEIILDVPLPTNVKILRVEASVVEARLAPVLRKSD